MCALAGNPAVRTTYRSEKVFPRGASLAGGHTGCETGVVTGKEPSAKIHWTLVFAAWQRCRVQPCGGNGQAARSTL
jgi:hypothetical protein